MRNERQPTSQHRHRAMMRRPSRCYSLALHRRLAIDTMMKQQRKSIERYIPRTLDAGPVLPYSSRYRCGVRGVEPDIPLACGPSLLAIQIGAVCNLITTDFSNDKFTKVE